MRRSLLRAGVGQLCAPHSARKDGTPSRLAGRGFPRPSRVRAGARGFVLGGIPPPVLARLGASAQTLSGSRRRAGVAASLAQPRPPLLSGAGVGARLSPALFRHFAPCRGVWGCAVSRRCKPAKPGFLGQLVRPPCGVACCPRLSWGSPFLRSRLPRGGSALSAVRVRPASCAWVAGSPLGRSPCGLRGGGRSVRRGYAGACAPAFCAPPRRCFAACARAAMPVGVGRGCSSAALAGGVVFRV